MQTVVVGMSGGVDSSVSALLLKQQGYRVIGLFMKNWEERDDQGVCMASKEYEDVERVCAHIGIPYYAVNFVQEYQDEVFADFVEQYKKGLTPNPDILCNREIKFKVLFKKALELGADFLATGHYCQVMREEGRALLGKGEDPGKDQSYFLYAVKADVLEKVLFPIGHLQKKEVREIARQNGLATSEKKDSTGICFIGERNFREFLSRYIPPAQGSFETLDGKKVGQHSGAAYYTIGQRKGMGIGGAGDAWFVVGKDVERNVVFVEQGTRHPALYCDDLIAAELTWVDEPPHSFPYACHSKIRYRQPDQACTIEWMEEGKVFVKYAVPQRAVTPGQSVVFYDGAKCLGGGIIQSSGPSYYARGLSLPDVVSP